MEKEIIFGRRDEYKEHYQGTQCFIDWINDAFEELQDNATNHITTGTRRITEIQNVIMGAWIMKGYGFDYKFRIEEYNPDGLPFGDKMLSFAIWHCGEEKNGTEPLYEWHALLYK